VDPRKETSREEERTKSLGGAREERISTCTIQERRGREICPQGRERGFEGRGRRNSLCHRIEAPMCSKRSKKKRNAQVEKRDRKKVETKKKKPC